MCAIYKVKTNAGSNNFPEKRMGKGLTHFDKLFLKQFLPVLKRLAAVR